VVAPRSPDVTSAASPRSIEGLGRNGRAVRRLSQEVTALPPITEAISTPAWSEPQEVGAKGRTIMRSVGLDLGARHIAFCEVRGGKVFDRIGVERLDELASRLGPGSAPARVGFEAAREAWHIHDLLKDWGHEPKIVDTTRLKMIGLGQHGRKNDALDAECIAMAIEQGNLPEAHVLSPERRELRKKLSIRQALVETRSQYVVTIRGLARSVGVLLPSCSPHNFLDRLRTAKLEDAFGLLTEPLAAVLEKVEENLAHVDDELDVLAKRDPLVQLCATVPGVGLIVAATFLSVLDDPKRFKNAHAVSAYLGLVPSEHTTGGPSKRRLGSITKQGNSHARSMLVQAAWALLNGGRYHAADPIRVWGLRIAKRRGKKLAAIAVARRLAGVLWAICRDGTFYSPTQQAADSVAGVRRRVHDDVEYAAALQRAVKKIRRRTSRRPTSEGASM
jgi:transposase